MLECSVDPRPQIAQSFNFGKLHKDDNAFLFVSFVAKLEDYWYDAKIHLNDAKTRLDASVLARNYVEELFQKQNGALEDLKTRNVALEEQHGAELEGLRKAFAQLREPAEELKKANAEETPKC